MPKPYPEEFRDDVVAVARKGQAPLSRTPRRTSGISEAAVCTAGEEGRRRGRPSSRPDRCLDRKELREANKRIRLLEQENEVLRRAAAYLSQAGNLPETRLPLVREMAAAGAPIRVPVAVACRVLGLSRQGVLPVAEGPRQPAGDWDDAHLINVVLESSTPTTRRWGTGS